MPTQCIHGARLPGVDHILEDRGELHAVLTHVGFLSVRWLLPLGVFVRIDRYEPTKRLKHILSSTTTTSQQVRSQVTRSNAHHSSWVLSTFSDVVCGQHLTHRMAQLGLAHSI